MTYHTSGKLAIVLLTQAMRENRTGSPYRPVESFAFHTANFERKGWFRKGDMGGFWLTDTGKDAYHKITGTPHG